MSTMIMAACWPLRMPPNPKAVLISLADQANDQGCCWPGVRSMMMRTCLSERAVREALSWLEATGAIRREFRSNQTSRYFITPEQFDLAKSPGKRPSRARRKPPAHGAAPAHSAPPAQSAPPPAQSAPAPALPAPLEVRSAHPNRKGTVKGTTNEPSLLARGASPPPQPVFDLGDGEVLPIEKTRSRSKAEPVTAAAWDAYARAYEERYGVLPTRNARVSAQMAQFIQRVPLDEAPEIAAFFVGINDRRLIADGHPIGMLLAKAETYRTQWATGRTMTTTRAAQLDRSQSNFDAVAEAMEILDRKGALA